MSNSSSNAEAAIVVNVPRVTVVAGCGWRVLCALWSVGIVSNAAAQVPASDPLEITLGMAMPKAVAVCRRRGDEVNVVYMRPWDLDEGGLSLPLDSRPPSNAIVALLKCVRSSGESRVRLRRVDRAFVVEHVEGLISLRALGMSLNSYVDHVARLYGAPALDDRALQRPIGGLAIEWVVPRRRTACATLRDQRRVSDTKAPCGSRVTFNFTGPSDAMLTIEFHISPLHHLESYVAAQGFDHAFAEAQAELEHLTVFGVRLSARRQFEMCGGESTFGMPPRSVPCFPKEAELDGPWDVRGYDPASEIFLGNTRGRPREVGFVPLKLPTDSCPDWISRDCLVSVAFQDDNVTGIAFITAGPSSETEVRAHLSEMFGAESDRGTSINCRSTDDTQLGTVSSTQHQWSPPHIVVEYQPVSGTACDVGLVRIQTAQLTEAFTSSATR